MFHQATTEDGVGEEGWAGLPGEYVPPVRVDAISEEGRPELLGLYVLNVRVDAISEVGRASLAIRRFHL